MCIGLGGQFFATFGGVPHLVAVFIFDPLALGPFGTLYAVLFGFNLALGLDVDAPTGEASCQPSILAFLANGQRELEVIHDDRGDASFLIETNFTNPGRGQSILDQLYGVVGIGNHVDALAAKFIGDHTYSATASTHARAYRIDVRVVTPDRDLGAVTRLTSGRTNLHKTRGDLWHLKLEESLHQTRVRATYDNLRTLGRLANFHDVRLESLPVLVVLVGHLLCLGHQCLNLAQVKQGIAVVSLLHDARDDVTFATGVLVVLHVTLDFANALHDDLLGSLSGDTTKVFWGVIPFAHHFTVFVQLLAVHANLAVVWVNGDDSFLS